MFILLNNTGGLFLQVVCHVTMAKKNMDVVICGGGIIGLSTAYFLAKKGVFPIVVEKHVIAGAASGQAGGFLARDWNKDSALDKFSEAGFDLHMQLAKVLGGQEEYGFRKLTSYSVALSDDKTASYHDNLPQWLDGNTIAGPVMKIGTTTTNAQIHPYQFCQHLHKACSNMGVIFRTKTEVTGIKYGNENKIVSLGSGEQLVADVVVIAMGAWSGVAKQWLSTMPAVIYGQKAHSITVVPQEPLSPEAVFISYGEMSPDIYPRPDGEAYACGIVDSPKPSHELEGADTVCPNAGACDRLKSIVSTMSTSLRQGTLNKTQACYIPLTQDGLPIIGALPGFNGIYVGAGHGCWGILNGPITGLALSELIMEGSASTVDISFFDPARFS